MNKNLLMHLIRWPKYFITGAELRMIVPGSSNSRKAIIKRAVHEGFLVRLKRNLYLIRNINSKLPINTFEIAQLIYGPSYISFESALSTRGWIPEAVPVICNATIKSSKDFKTKIATFSYEKIPNKIFSQGVTQIKEGDSCYFMADPWKAIADMIYTRKKSWRNAIDLMGDLRIETNHLLDSNVVLLNKLSTEYPHKQTRKILQSLFKNLIQLKGDNNGNRHHQ